MRDLKVEAKQADNGIELQLVGELIFSDTKQFMTDIPIRVRDKGPCVILNLDKLKFIDSAGLGSILYVSEALRMQCQSLRIINANNIIKNLLSKIKGVGTFILED
ncbi:MAG: hypothetical protein BWY28_01192 [bacterium ADurb.Bin236]|nr:MAG: hypothetical protein BWY28_01192 [bacterium ADurb.Bin236]